MRDQKPLGGLILLLVLAGCSIGATEEPTLARIPTVAHSPTAVPTSLDPQQPTPEVTDQPTELQTPVLPDPEQFTWQEFASGFNRPVDLVSPLDGSTSLFLVEQNGIIRIIENDQVLPRPFLDLSARVTTRGNEQGLLGMAFHPDYPGNGFFFLNYTDVQGDTVIARFRVSSDPQVADAASEFILMQIPQPYGNHNGGGLAFGPDGFLYIGLGDGGSAGDPEGNAQATDSLLGKMLRIDVSQPGDGYSIPADNPFADGGGAPEIWALGLRNPWRFSFDRANGDLWIGDVGQNLYEEVNHLPTGSPPGVNFGWDYREGFHPYEGEVPAGLILTDPVWEYDRSGGCSVTGGVVYRGSDLPEWQGVYLAADYCNGNIWGLVPDGSSEWTASLLYQTGANISSIAQDASGEVFLLDHRGRVLKLVRR